MISILIFLVALIMIGLGPHSFNWIGGIVRGIYFIFSKPWPITLLLLIAIFIAYVAVVSLIGFISREIQRRM